jgi:hypothetical protein
MSSCRNTLVCVAVAALIGVSPIQESTSAVHSDIAAAADSLDALPDFDYDSAAQVITQTLPGSEGGLTGEPNRIRLLAWRSIEPLALEDSLPILAEESLWWATIIDSLGTQTWVLARGCRITQGGPFGRRWQLGGTIHAPVQPRVVYLGPPGNLDIQRLVLCRPWFRPNDTVDVLEAGVRSRTWRECLGVDPPQDFCK